MKNKNQSSGVTPMLQLEAYLKDNEGLHYNFEKQRLYTVSSGSLLLDIEMGGGIKPGVVRATGVTEGGKTSCGLSFARNFQKMEKSMVIYVKAEGRLSDDLIQRAGIDTDPKKWFVFKCNIYETVINLIRQMVKDNPKDYRYMFVIDSMDALIPKNDMDKGSEEALKVGGGALLSSDFLRRMALALAERGHICYMISQVRSTIKINPYERSDPQVTNASGGNAALHYSDWILEFQPRYMKDIISTLPNGKGEMLGHWCKLFFRKSPNEKTGASVRYPIRYERTDGKSIWVEYEVVDMLLQWDMAQAKGAWVTISDDLVDEVKRELDLEFKKQHQGMDNLRKYFEENKEIGKFLFHKFRDTLKKF
jgi:RecA/RadA recombinase